MCLRQRIGSALNQHVDQADCLCGNRIDAAATKDHVECVTHTLLAVFVGQQPRQTLRAAIARQQAQPNFGLTKASCWLGNAVMAGKRKLHPAAKRDALHCRDARLTHHLDFAESKLGIVRQHHRFVARVYFFKHLANVGTSNE